MTKEKVMATDGIEITPHSVLQCNWAPNLVFEIGTLHPNDRGTYGKLRSSWRKKLLGYYCTRPRRAGASWEIFKGSLDLTNSSEHGGRPKNLVFIESRFFSLSALS